MLPYLRWSLFAAGVVFFSLIGFTAENFIIEVARRLVPIDPQNQVLFNVLHIAATILPIVAIGLLLHAAMGSERGMVPLLWTILFGVILGVVGLRVEQLVKILKAGSELPPVIPPSRYQAYFFDYIAPYLYLGVLSFLPTIFYKSTLKISVNIVISSVTLAFLWIVGSGKAPVTHSSMMILAGYSVSLTSALGALFAARKMNLIS